LRPSELRIVRTGWDLLAEDKVLEAAEGVPRSRCLAPSWESWTTPQLTTPSTGASGVGEPGEVEEVEAVVGDEAGLSFAHGVAAEEGVEASMVGAVAEGVRFLQSN